MHLNSAKQGSPWDQWCLTASDPKSLQCTPWCGRGVEVICILSFTICLEASNVHLPISVICHYMLLPT